MEQQDDFTGSLPMYGVDESAGDGLGFSLGAYVRQVAAATGVPADGTSYEESDTATAYIGLPARVPAFPNHDLMLVWDEGLGWRVETEPVPDEPPHSLGRLRGDPVPPPAAVAAFVTEIVAGKQVMARRARTAPPAPAAEPVDNSA